MARRDRDRLAEPFRGRLVAGRALGHAEPALPGARATLDAARERVETGAG
jgi:hypothetical protein